MIFFAGAVNYPAAKRAVFFAFSMAHFFRPCECPGVKAEAERP
jgi:hypothetical protein